jgi:hypothetical protein
MKFWYTLLTFTNPVKELKVIEDDEPYPFD